MTSSYLATAWKRLATFVTARGGTRTPASPGWLPSHLATAADILHAVGRVDPLTVEVTPSGVTLQQPPQTVGHFDPTDTIDTLAGQLSSGTELAALAGVDGLLSLTSTTTVHHATVTASGLVPTTPSPQTDTPPRPAKTRTTSTPDTVRLLRYLAWWAAPLDLTHARSCTVHDDVTNQWVQLRVGFREDQPLQDGEDEADKFLARWSATTDLNIDFNGIDTRGFHSTGYATLLTGHQLVVNVDDLSISCH